MKGREQSPVKKRSRAPDDSRDRGGNSRKPGAPLTVNGSSSSRRNLHHDKRDMREPNGHGSSSRCGGGSFDYAVKSNGGARPGGMEGHWGAEPAPAPRVSLTRTVRKPGLGGADIRPRPPPESDYRTLKISGIWSELSDGEVEDGLFDEFIKYGDVSFKFSRENEQRVVFVNFRRPEDARAGKHARAGKLMLYDRPLQIDPVYDRLRSRSPVSKEMYPPVTRHVPPQRQLSPTGVGYRDYRPHHRDMDHHRDLDRGRDFPCDSRSRPPFEPPAFHDEDIEAPEFDKKANRTLFLGNLDVRVTESELQRAFECFGVITEVDIKIPKRGKTSHYGFIKFENLDMAHRAKLAMDGKVLGLNPIKIGYGKPTPTTRLWVGGLGPWVSLLALDKDFNRFGTIRTIDYREGDVWAYIQYESLVAAQAAFTNMRGFPLGGPHRRIRVDFADTKHPIHTQQPLMPLSLSPYHVPEPERSPSFSFRDRDISPPAEWSGPGIHDRIRGGGGYEVRNRTFNPKKRPLEQGWHPERSPEFGRRRHGRSMDRSSFY